MNEQVEKFFEKARGDETLRAELGALAGLPAAEIVKKAAAIAQENGFDVTAEDFVFSEAELDEGDLDTVAGGLLSWKVFTKWQGNEIDWSNEFAIYR